MRQSLFVLRIVRGTLMHSAGKIEESENIAAVSIMPIHVLTPLN